MSMSDRDRSHLSIVRIFAPRSKPARKKRKAITSLQSKRRQKAEEGLSEARAMMQGAQRIIQKEFIGKLPPDQGTVMWGVFSLKPEEQIAEELGLSVTEIRLLRGEAERTLGGRLNF